MPEKPHGVEPQLDHARITTQMIEGSSPSASGLTRRRTVCITRDIESGRTFIQLGSLGQVTHYVKLQRRIGRTHTTREVLSFNLRIGFLADHIYEEGDKEEVTKQIDTKGVVCFGPYALASRPREPAHLVDERTGVWAPIDEALDTKEWNMPPEVE